MRHGRQQQLYQQLRELGRVSTQLRDTHCEKLVVLDSVKQGDFDKGHASLQALKVGLGKEIIQKCDDRKLSS
ncbi:hypothetical protein CB1_000622015 [Camelus ferus]|nr:hypothetical protein CB1_000622015 [Camelus ferus]